MVSVMEYLEELHRSMPKQLSVAGVIRWHNGTEEHFVIDPDRQFMAASVAKLSIALRVEGLVEDGPLNWNDELELKRSHIRRGTGVLRAFPVGTKLTLLQAFNLMLSESDNTATNVVLGHVDSQLEINRWIHRLTAINTGLTNRPDRLFESTTMSPRDALRLLKMLGPVARAAMGQSHFVDGLRRPFAHFGLWSRSRYMLIMALAKACSAPGLNRLPRAWLIDFAINRRPSDTQVENKEGILTAGGKTYLHDVGVIRLLDKAEIYIAVFTEDAPKGTIPLLTLEIIKHCLRV